MRYSVWNDHGTYSVYESDVQPKSRISTPTSLGAVPSQIVRTLPQGAKYLGDSEAAVGEIVISSMGFKEFALLIAAGIIARWIYEKFLV